MLRSVPASVLTPVLTPVLVAAIALAVAGCTGDDAPAVEVEPVGAGEVVEVVSAPGRVDAAARQEVAAPVSGTVAEIAAVDGARVVAGQVVLRLQSEQVDLAQQQAALAQQAAAGTGGIDVGPGGGGTTREATVDAVVRLDERAAPAIADARAQAATVADPAQRAALARAIDGVEQAYLATREAVAASGTFLAEQQDATAAALQSALDQAVAAAAAPQQAQADAVAAAAAAQLDDLVLRAPFDGTIQLGQAAASDGLPSGGAVPADLAGLASGLAGGLAGADEGSTLRVGAPVALGQPLFVVYELSRRYVEASVDEVDAPAVEPGQDVTAFVDALPDVGLAGVVEAVRVEAERTETGGVGYGVRVLLEGDPATDEALGRLRVGMTASVDIATRTVEADRVVPSRALLRREDGSAVFVVRGGRAVEVPVEVVALGEDRAAVEGDLRSGDRVVVAGYEDLADGDPVRS